MLFELLPNGRRRYRRALLTVPKGCGKTSLAAWIGLYMLATQPSAVVPVVAASYDQANLVFNDMRTCVSESPTLRRVMTGFEPEIQVDDSPSRAFKVPAVAGVNDGMRPSTAIFDEIHEFITPNQTRTHLVIGNGCTKRAGSLQLNVTTPGWDPDSLAGKLHTHGLKVNAGEVVDDEFLFVWWGCPADRYDLTTEEGLHAAIRDASPAADKFLNVADVAARYHQVPENEFLRYHCAQWVAAETAWLPAGVWDSLADPGVSIRDGDEVCIGFDGSRNNDSTAIVAATCGPIPHIEIVQLWERPEHATDDWSVPILEVEDVIRAACRRWRVREIVADPWGWQRSLQILEGEGVTVVSFPQTAQRMGPATTRFQVAAMNHGLTHNGDPRLARHIANALLKVDPRGQRIVKETTYSRRKVDAAVAACMVFDRAAQPVEPEYNILESVW
ncbi:terminase TerL endonuclease subunit [Mycobacterium sp.]|uniref:terminase TerL endonuclease subunit n=1 Tax=Mycobacterium sp. TaxID=1785 RepID=UPI003F9D05AF